MNQATILTAVIDLLKNSTHLSYISDSNILSGVREGMTKFPMLIVEDGPDREEEYVYPVQRLKYTIFITGIIQVYDMDKQFVGDANIKGIKDIENDIYLALDEDPTLSGKCIHMRSVGRDPGDIADFPYRSFTINVEILFQQTKNVR